MAGPARPVALIIEDDEQIASILQFILQREGYAVELARDGKTAQACVERLAPPAIVMLDVMLPYVDGYQLLVQMRSRRGWDELPIIILTAKAQEKDIVRALDAGASDYVVKPFKPEELRARVRRLAKK